MTSGLPTPPTEGDMKHVSSSGRSAKSAKSSNRGIKRNTSSSSHEHTGVVIDGRHKRVWKACERCRMKKTKCDGESPCKRCKDDGLVCTAGSRKKTEFKQLPRGYAEVLENTQYALIATVQKLYTMVRNGESWDLGEPDVNDRGLPVIHNIAEKLGCIRPSPDLPYAFPEDADEFAELQAQMKMENYDVSDRKHSGTSTSSNPSRNDRASSSESDHSELSKDYTQMLWAQQQQQGTLQRRYPLNDASTPRFGEEPLYLNEFKQEPVKIKDSNFDMKLLPSPVYSDLQAQSDMQSPIFSDDSPFSPWAGNDEFMGPSHMLDLTALYMRQQQQLAYQQPSVLARSAPSIGSSCTNVSPQVYMAASDGTIQPGMLDCHTGFEVAGPMENVMFGDYEAPALRMS